MDVLSNKLGNMMKGAYASLVAVRIKIHLFIDFKHKILLFLFKKKPPTVSRFFEEGILTPQEFVAAGDQLVSASPSWSWKPAASEKHRNQSLPADKQYLTTQAQCSKRIKEDASVQKEVE